jgi:hypothetical protein
VGIIALVARFGLAWFRHEAQDAGVSILHDTLAAAGASKSVGRGLNLGKRSGVNEEGWAWL